MCSSDLRHRATAEVCHRLQEIGLTIDDATLQQWLDAELLLPSKDTR